MDVRIVGEEERERHLKMNLSSSPSLEFIISFVSHFPDMLFTPSPFQMTPFSLSPSSLFCMTVWSVTTLATNDP